MTAVCSDPFSDANFGMERAKPAPTSDDVVIEDKSADWLSGAHLAELHGVDVDSTIAEAIEDQEARSAMLRFAQLHRDLGYRRDTPLDEINAMPAVVAQHLGHEPTRREVAEHAAATGIDDPHEVGRALDDEVARRGVERKRQRETDRELRGVQLRGDTRFSIAEVERAGKGDTWAVRAVEQFHAANRIAWHTRGGEHQERYGITAADLIRCGATGTFVADMSPMTDTDLDAAVHDVALRRQADQIALRRESAQMEAANAAAEVEIPDRVDLAKFTPEPVRWVVNSVLSQGAVLGLFAERKAGKSRTVRELIRAALSGDQFLGRFDVSLPADAEVVLFDTEMPLSSLYREIQGAGVHHLDRLNLRSLRGVERSFDVRDEATQARWSEVIKPGSLIIVDCLYTLFGALGISENSDEVLGLLTGMRSLATQCGAAGLVLVHHLGKDTDRGARGHSSIEAFPDAIARIGLDGPPSPTTERTFSAYGRDDADVGPGLLTIGSDGRLLIGDDPHVERAASRHRTDDDAVHELIRTHPGLSGRNLGTLPASERGRLSRDRIRDAITRLELVNRIENKGTKNAVEWHANEGVDPFETPESARV